jgi:hypothetical protein
MFDMKENWMKTFLQTIVNPKVGKMGGWYPWTMTRRRTVKRHHV